jgi:hypothetical protein
LCVEDLREGALLGSEVGSCGSSAVGHVGGVMPIEQCDAGEDGW